MLPQLVPFEFIDHARVVEMLDQCGRADLHGFGSRQHSVVRELMEWRASAQQISRHQEHGRERVGTLLDTRSCPWAARMGDALSSRSIVKKMEQFVRKGKASSSLAFVV